MSAFFRLFYRPRTLLICCMLPLVVAMQKMLGAQFITESHRFANGHWERWSLANPLAFWLSFAVALMVGLAVVEAQRSMRTALLPDLPKFLRRGMYCALGSLIVAIPGLSAIAGMYPEPNWVEVASVPLWVTGLTSLLGVTLALCFFILKDWVSREVFGFIATMGFLFQERTIASWMESSPLIFAPLLAIGSGLAIRRLLSAEAFRKRPHERAEKPKSYSGLVLFGPFFEMKPPGKSWGLPAGRHSIHHWLRAASFERWGMPELLPLRGTVALSLFFLLLVLSIGFLAGILELAGDDARELVGDLIDPLRGASFSETPYAPAAYVVSMFNWALFFMMSIMVSGFLSHDRIYPLSRNTRCRIVFLSSLTQLVTAVSLAALGCVAVVLVGRHFLDAEVVGHGVPAFLQILWVCGVLLPTIQWSVALGLWNFQEFSWASILSIPVAFVWMIGCHLALSVWLSLTEVLSLVSELALMGLALVVSQGLYYLCLRAYFARADLTPSRI